MKIFKHKQRDSSLPITIDNFFSKNPTEPFFNLSTFETLPSVNIEESEKEYKFEMALPGFKKEDVNIELDDDFIVIYSEKENKKENKKWMRKEYSYSSFCRRFKLPEDADIDNISAKMKKGILKISITKNKEFISNKKNIIVN